jgi:hypothetical protein
LTSRLVTGKLLTFFTVYISAGDGKIANLFLQCTQVNWSLSRLIIVLVVLQIFKKITPFYCDHHTLSDLWHLGELFDL